MSLQRFCLGTQMFPTQQASRTELVAHGHQSKAWHIVEMVWMRQCEHPEETGMREETEEMLWFLMTGVWPGCLKSGFRPGRAVGCF